MLLLFDLAADWSEIKNPDPKDPNSGFQVSGVRRNGGFRCQVSGVRKKKYRS
jgi:hypothetical protein